MEDCAIALDSSKDGIRVGNWGDAAIFSTDHTKPINTIIGGLLYTKDKFLYENARHMSLKMNRLDLDHQKRLFNQFIFERRNFIPSNYPRSIFINRIQAIIHRLAFNNYPLTFLEEDYNRNIPFNQSYPYPAAMPPFLAQLGLFELDHWPEEKQRRKNLLKQYLSTIAQSKFNVLLPRAYHNPDMEIVPLRFVFRHPDSGKLMKKMALFVDVNWTWFREPVVCCPEGPESLGYSFGSCQVAEKACRDIINWPCVVPENWDSKIIDIFRKIINEFERNDCNEP